MIINFELPASYVCFIKSFEEKEIFEVPGTGIIFYNISDLPERNETYEVEIYESDYFMIGQDGDTGYFVNKKNNQDESIYSNGLGAIGSLPMKKEAENIFDFINKNML